MLSYRMNEYGVMRITTRYNQSRVRPIYTNTQYMEYLESNDYSSGGIAEVVGNPLIQVKPYFDLDSKKIIFTDEYINEIANYIKDEYGLTVKFLKRKDRTENGKIKSSLRGYAQEARITHYLIPVVFEKLFNKYESIDKSVYNIGRILHTLGNKKKGIDDVPALEIYGDTNDDIQNYFATYIKETYRDLDETVDINIRTSYDNIIKQKLKLKEEVGKPIEVEEEKLTHLAIKLINIVKRLSKKRSTDYNTWSHIIWCIINICNANDITEAQCNKIVHIFSAMADNYDTLSVDEWFDNVKNNMKDTGYGWTYLYKCLKEDDPNYYDRISKSYYNEKQEFEQTHLKCMYPDCIITIDNDNVIVSTISSIEKAYHHKKCVIKDDKKEDKYKEVRFMTKWLDDPWMRCVNKMTFKPPPLVVNENEFNLWTPYQILKEPYVKNDEIIRLFLEFTNNLLGETFAQFSIASKALKVQTPAKRSYVCEVLYSQSEGTGKNTYYNTFIAMFGRDKFKQLESANQLYETHSTEEKGSMFILVDEAKGSDNYQNADRLKSRITCDVVRLNPKNIAPYEIPNYCDYLMTTNNHNCVPQNDESRRFAPIEVSNHYKGNCSFFTTYNNQIINNKEAIRCIYEYLMNFNINSVIPTGNFQNHIPKTELMLELNYDNRNRVDLFLEAIANGDVELDDDEIKKSNLFNKFNIWMSNCKFDNRYNVISFGRKLSTTIKSKNIDITVTNRSYIINMNSLKKVYSPFIA